ncbi:MBL fold metallo-hydrolase [Alicyclobacillus fastidiosus]|uniref:MBL fold metallo-hydrolase n=1 Tax=Alicyclobacillus fastidiosus TaxID=392011 RepID=A0ABV5AC37_9BACL|nr:MBL fold metallo-hydrolase [Alicyclobacillus fastidiosus]WEH11495.1 MBL fold metallo-hydrolase [Alicyclobacillus fastidiosus]
MPENHVRTGSALIREVDETKVPFGMLAIWFLGQCSVIVKGADTVLYIDPYLSSSPYRAFEPPLKPEELTNAQVVLITHEHLDHLDSDTISRLAAVKDDTVYMAPRCCKEELLRCRVPADKIHAARTNEWWPGPGFRVKPIASAHEELEWDAELDHRYVGYIVELNGVTLYHAGDTTVYPGLVEALKAESIDLGLLPINGRDPFRNARNLVGNMNYREAVELAVAAEFQIVIPTHYDMFAGNSEKPGYFLDYLYENYPTQKSHVLARFERYMYVSDSILS